MLLSVCLLDAPLVGCCMLSSLGLIAVVLCCIVLLTESLLSLKKNRLLASLDAALLQSLPANDSGFTDATPSHGALDMDAEFAAFQVIIWIFSVTKCTFC